MYIRLKCYEQVVVTKATTCEGLRARARARACVCVSVCVFVFVLFVPSG
jgi:hypothetical protein